MNLLSLDFQENEMDAIPLVWISFIISSLIATLGGTISVGPSQKLLDSEIWNLQEELLNGYNPTVRPVPSPLDPVNVTIDLVLFNLVNLDEYDQTFQTNCKLILAWKDHFLQWNPDDHAGIKQTRLDPNRIWIPDVILYNSASTDYKAAVISTMAMVVSDGTVKLLLSALFTSVCNNLNVDYFPFDEQSCFLKFAPWTMDVSAVKLNYKTEKGSMDSYSPIGKFKLLSISAVKSSDKDPCCSNTSFDAVTYTINIHRRPMFYIINYIFPSTLINAIGCMVFYVPCHSQEKVTLGISAMLTMVVFLMTMSEAMPPATATPLLSVYYCACIVLVTLEVLFSILVLNIFHRGQYGKRASDPLVAVAAVMAKVTFTEMKDPSGHFGERKVEIAAKIRSFLRLRPKPEVGIAGSTTLNATSANDELSDAARDLEDKLAEEQFWKPGVEGTSNYYSTIIAEVRKQNGGFPTSEEEFAFASKFGYSHGKKGPKGEDELIFSVDDLTVNNKKSVLHRFELPLELVKMASHLAQQADRAIEVMKINDLRYKEEVYKASLELEFLELSRIFDRFFMWVSIVGTVVTSLGILMSSPYSSMTTGV